MDFFDNVVNKSNAIIKERLNNPFGNKQQTKDDLSQSQDDGQQQQQKQQSEGNDEATPCLESAARQQQQLNSQDSNASSNAASTDPNNADKNSQFAAIAADAEAVAQKAAKGAKNIGTFLFSMANKAGQTVTQTAKQVKQAVESTTILTDFTREQQEFIKEHGGSMQAGGLPWDDCQHEDKAAYIREQILSLSQDKRNFVRGPPNDSEFTFDPQSCYPIALSLLKEDPNLNKMRYELVPKLVNEDTFWRNYFFRVSMLKQMSEKGERSKQGWVSSRSSSGEGPDEEGTGTPHDTIDEPMSPGYSASSATATAKTTTTTIDRQQKQESFHLDTDKANEAFVQSSLSNDHSGAAAAAATTTTSTTSTTTAPQYQPQDLESKESSRLLAEADDLKSKLRELNIGSLDDGNDEDNEKWEEELQRDLQEFELVSGGDLSALDDEESLQTDIMQLKGAKKGGS